MIYCIHQEDRPMDIEINELGKNLILRGGKISKKNI